MKNVITKFENQIQKIASLPPLVARISLGAVFAESGWGKLNNLDQVIEYFTSLGIAFAHLQAPFVAGLEFVGGILLIIGFFTRFISVPLIVVMVVAILKAKLEEVTSITDIFAFSEYLYILLLASLFTSGAGVLSLDQLVFKKGDRS